MGAVVAACSLAVAVVVARAVVHDVDKIQQVGQAGIAIGVPLQPGGNSAVVVVTAEDFVAVHIAERVEVSRRAALTPLTLILSPASLRMERDFRIPTTASLLPAATLLLPVVALLPAYRLLLPVAALLPAARLLVPGAALLPVAV